MSAGSRSVVTDHLIHSRHGDLSGPVKQTKAV